MVKNPSAEDQVRNFYDQSGWSADDEGHSLDARLWEDLRNCAKDYVAHCRLRVLKHLPRSGEKILDAASGPIQYPEYLEFSRHFQKRYCLDISAEALEQAKKKLGDRGEYVKASLLELPFPKDFFDAGISLHTIYHIHRNDQEKAVRELIRVTKPGAPLVVVYANPDRPTHKLKALLKKPEETSGPIYYHAYPLSWWRQFEDECEVKIEPWRALTASASKKLVPDSTAGKRIFGWLEKLEDSFPQLATRLGAYPMIILRKRAKNTK